MSETLSFDLSVDYTSCKPVLERVERGQTEVTPDEALKMLSELTDAREQLICAQVLGFENTRAALSQLKGDIANPTTPASAGDVATKKGEGGGDVAPPENANLPLAPTTAFNVMRLVQLGYFPKDYTALWGDKPNMFHKGVQAAYVLPGKLGEWARTKANTAFQKKYDRDAAYKDFMLDLTKQMDAELKDWFRQNKLADKANIDAARQSLDAMKASLTAGKDKEAFAHFDALTEKMGMRVNGMWHEKSPADLATARAEQDTKTTAADARVQKAKDQKKLREGQVKGAKDDLKIKKADIDELYAREGGHGVDSRFNVEGVKASDIDTEIRKLELEKVTLARHDVALRGESHDIQSAVNGRDFAAVQNDRNTVGYVHTTKSDTFLPVGSQLANEQGHVSRVTSEINDYEKTKGYIEVATKEHEEAKKTLSGLQEEAARLQGQILDTTVDASKKPGLQARLDQLNGVLPGTPGLIESAKGEVERKEAALDTRRSELETKKGELRNHEQNRKSLLLQSEQNKVAFDWYSKRVTRINQIDQQIRAYGNLKPLVEARNKAARKLAQVEKSVTKASEAATKREQLAREAHTSASPIHDALDKLSDPSISRSERLAMNEKLNDLLAQKKPEAERIERLLKGTQSERNQAVRELQAILDTNGKGVDFFKSSLDGIEGKIKGLQSEASRIMTEYDKQAGTGDVEALRKKMETDIGKINAEIERYNADARVKYGAAAATLTPVQLESLHLQTKLGAFFDTMNKGTTKLESLGSTKVGGKAMRGIYGAMTLAGLGQIGVTTANSGIKQGAIDVADLGIGFIPVVGGAYDIVVGGAQFLIGSEITSDRVVTKTDALKRMGFGVLGLVPIAGQMFKAAAKGEKLVEVARKVAVVERTAQVTGKVLILNEAKNLGVALYDATGSIVAENGGIKKTAESLYTGTRFPVNTHQ